MIRVGKIVATHGHQGGLIFTHVVGNSKWLKNNAVLFIELNKNSYIPFFVTNYKKANPEEYIISLEDIASMEAGKKLVGKHVYVEEDILSGYADDSPLLWIGFKVMDNIKGDLGVIAYVMLTGQQWLAKIMMGDKEVLLPLVVQTIEKINLKTKTLYTKMPEGLVEMYLE